MAVLVEQVRALTQVVVEVEEEVVAAWWSLSPRAHQPVGRATRLRVLAELAGQRLGQALQAP